MLTPEAYDLLHDIEFAIRDALAEAKVPRSRRTFVNHAIAEAIINDAAAVRQLNAAAKSASR